jgi:hypothetical protein
MAEFTIAGRRFQLEHLTVEEAAAGVLPEPVREHYVVVRGRRFPPKQIMSRVTGLDRADFTTHQARRILKRLGFVAARAGRDDNDDEVRGGDGPHNGRQAAALGPYVGQWVALATPTEVLVAADSPAEVLGWLTKHERRASFGMFRVPASVGEAEGLAPQ